MQAPGREQNREEHRGQDDDEAAEATAHPNDAVVHAEGPVGAGVCVHQTAKVGTEAVQDTVGPYAAQRLHGLGQMGQHAGRVDGLEELWSLRTSERQTLQEISEGTG